MGTEATDGRPWVLLPGTLCTGAVFDGLLDALGVPMNARRVIDLQHSQLEDYVADLTDAVEPTAIVCGFSLGAIVAAHLADRMDVSQIVLFGLNPHSDDPAKREGRLSLALDVATKGGAAALADRLPPLAGPDAHRAQALVLSMADEAQQWIEAQTAIALNRPGAFEALTRARCPVTMLTGTNDEQAPLSQAHEAAIAAPQGWVVPLDGLGHYALVEDPDACADALSNIWKTQ